MAVHFQNAMYGLIRNLSCFLTDQIFIEVQDQFKIMLAQTVLAVIFKCCCKENMLFLNIGKFLTVMLSTDIVFIHSFIDRASRYFVFSPLPASFIISIQIPLTDKT